MKEKLCKFITREKFELQSVKLQELVKSLTLGVFEGGGMVAGILGLFEIGVGLLTGVDHGVIYEVNTYLNVQPYVTGLALQWWGLGIIFTADYYTKLKEKRKMKECLFDQSNL